MFISLSEIRLVRYICLQFRIRFQKFYEVFVIFLRIFEAYYCGRFEKTEEKRMRVRKCYAFKIVRFVLESILLRDVVVYGMSQMGREVGRGQYGVVYLCECYVGYQLCVIKFVVFFDDKYWNDLVLEFFYIRYCLCILYFDVCCISLLFVFFGRVILIDKQVFFY